MAAIAFFDLDRTLIASNSALLWFWQEIKSRKVKPGELLKGAFLLMRYSLGKAVMDSAVVTTIAAMKGRSEKDLDIRMTQFYHDKISKQVRPYASKALAWHRERNDRLVLLTSSSKYLSRLIARDLQLDDFLCTELEVDATGLFTGKPIGLPCFGLGKLHAAQAYAANKQIDLNACTFYTDSASDLPVLEAVGFPVAINPDLRLCRIAQKRAWPIYNWGKPLKNY